MTPNTDIFDSVSHSQVSYKIVLKNSQNSQKAAALKKIVCTLNFAKNGLHK